MNIRHPFCLLIVFIFSCLATDAAEITAKPPELKVSIVRVAAEEHSLVVRFENRTPNPVVLLRPLDGSTWGWHMPIYDVTVTDSTGHIVKLALRCAESGLSSKLGWPDDYRILIQPNAFEEISMGLPQDLLPEGRYTVRFRYTYDSATKGSRASSEIVYPADLWNGSIISPATEIEVHAWSPKN